jgi:hypothetical protein
VIYTIFEPEDYNNKKFSFFDSERAAPVIATIDHHL